MCGSQKYTDGELAKEFATACLGDERLTRRLQSIVTALSRKPDVGFPMAFGDEAASEGFYRFVRNSKVTSRQS